MLDALRRAGDPIRAPDLVRAVMIDNRLDPSDRAGFAHVQWKVRDTLNRLNKRGLLASDGVGHGVLWRIADRRLGKPLPSAMPLPVSRPGT